MVIQKFKLEINSTSGFIKPQGWKVILKICLVTNDWKTQDQRRKMKKEKIMDGKFLMTIDILQNFVYKIVWSRPKYQAIFNIKVKVILNHHNRKYKPP